MIYKIIVVIICNKSQTSTTYPSHLNKVLNTRNLPTKYLQRFNFGTWTSWNLPSPPSPPWTHPQKNISVPRPFAVQIRAALEPAEVDENGASLHDFGVPAVSFRGSWRFFPEYVSTNLETTVYGVNFGRIPCRNDCWRVMVTCETTNN